MFDTTSIYDEDNFYHYQWFHFAVRERMLQATCRILIHQDAQNTLVLMETEQLRLEIPLEKLFEPWSSSGPVNKGLGMYQARKQAQAAGGDLFAEALGTGLRVVLSIPCKNS